MSRDKRSISVRSLRELWAKYTAFRASQLAPSTVKRDYGKIARRLDRLSKEAPDLVGAISIRDWLLQHYSADIARRTLIQFNACTKWAMNSDLLSQNPFEGVATPLKRRSPTARQWAAFTAQERDVVIQEFETRHNWLSYWVKFLFWTGCRPEEGAALRWEHISFDCREMLIAEAFPDGMDAPQQTKNYKVTRFPCNSRLQRLLREVRPEPCDRAQFVFRGSRGGKFDYRNFQTDYWRPLVLDLANRGRIAFYLSQYHARHTFITEGLRAGISVPDMAYLCRVSTHVLYKHYVDRTRTITVPEF